MKLSVYGNRVYSYSGISLYQNLGRVALLEERNTYVKLILKQTLGHKDKDFIYLGPNRV